MAQYIPFDPNIKVLGQTILSFVNALPAFKEAMLKVLANHQLTDIQNEKWYSQKLWLDAFREIGENYGSNTLFSIGKAIPESAIFPKEIDNLEKALASIDMAYHMNHTDGEIGYYKLKEYNAGLKTAIMECMNPYPSHFDRGIIMTMARKFKPVDSMVVKVELDQHLPSRLNGADSCTFRITW